MDVGEAEEEEEEEQDIGARLLLEGREARAGLEEGAGAKDEVEGTPALCRQARAEATARGRARGLALGVDDRSGPGGVRRRRGRLQGLSRMRCFLSGVRLGELPCACKRVDFA